MRATAITIVAVQMREAAVAMPGHSGFPILAKSFNATVVAPCAASAPTVLRLRRRSSYRPERHFLHQREDVGEHIAALPKNEHAAPEWQAAMQALIMEFVAFEYDVIGTPIRQTEKPQRGSSPTAAHPGQLEID